MKLVAALVGAAALLAVASAWGVGAFDRAPTPPPRPARYRQAMARVDRYLEVRSGGGSRTAGGWTWECHARGGRLEQLTGWSVPAVVSQARTSTGLRPIGEVEPGDAPGYARDVHRLFSAGLDRIIGRMGAGYGVDAIDRAVDRRARRELLGGS
jgi:hypothetical protein